MNFLNDVFNTAQKIKFSIKDFFRKCTVPQFTVDLVTFTEEILNGKLHFLCSVRSLVKVSINQVHLFYAI